MKDAIVSLSAIAAAAYILSMDVRLWPISALFASAGVVMWFVFKAQDRAHERALVSRNPTEARSIYGGGLLVVILFIAVVFMMLSEMGR